MERVKKQLGGSRNEEGSIMVIALLILMLLTIIGISATNTATVEMHVAANDLYHKRAFFSSEAARTYVSGTVDLYHENNITVGSGTAHYFPNDTDPYVPNTTDDSVRYDLGYSQSFNGNVEYTGSTVPPRGSGYEAGKFKAHRYTMTCNGYGPRNAQTVVTAGFFRIGY